MDIGGEKKSIGSSFLNFKRGADAFLGVTGKKGKGKNPFDKAPDFPKPRSVSELTKRQTFAPLSPTSPVGYSNADIQTAMRVLANSSNRDVVRLIPMDIVQPVRKQTKNIPLGSSSLGNVGP